MAVPVRCTAVVALPLFLLKELFFDRPFNIFAADVLGNNPCDAASTGASDLV